MVSLYGILHFASAIVFFAFARRSIARGGERVAEGAAITLDLTTIYMVALWIGAPLLFAAASGGSMFGSWGGALVFLAGLALYLACRPRDRGVAADAAAVALPAALALGKLGCLAAGCCFGRETHVPWSIVYRRGSLAPAHVPLHPTQLYDALVLVVAASFAAAVARRRPRGGESLAASVLVMCIGRFLTELTRGEPFPLTGPGITWTQLIVAIGGTLALGALLIPVLRSASRRFFSGRYAPPNDLQVVAPLPSIGSVILVTVGSVLSAVVIALVAVGRLLLPSPSTTVRLAPSRDLFRWAALATVPIIGAGVRTMGRHSMYSASATSIVRAVSLSCVAVLGLAAFLALKAAGSRAPIETADVEPVGTPPPRAPERRRRRRRPG